MSAVLASPIRTTSGLELAEAPRQHFWFDPPAPRIDVAAERRHRQERLAAHSACSPASASHRAAGHITARDPELPDHFWVNPLGVARRSRCPTCCSSTRGETAIGNALNKAAFAIHAAIHEAHPHIVAAAHTHSTYGKAWSTLGRLLDPLTQDACVFYEARTVRRLHGDGRRHERRRTDRRGPREAGRHHAQGCDPEEPRDPERWPDGRGRRRGTSRSTTPRTRSCWPRRPARRNRSITRPRATRTARSAAPTARCTHSTACSRASSPTNPTCSTERLSARPEPDHMTRTTRTHTRRRAR